MSDDVGREEEKKEEEESTTPEVASAPVRPGVPWGLSLFLIGVVLLVVFVVQNAQLVALKFLGWEGEYPLSLIIILVIAVTILLDEILGGVLRSRRRHRRADRDELRRLRKER